MGVCIFCIMYFLEKSCKLRFFNKYREIYNKYRKQISFNVVSHIATSVWSQLSLNQMPSHIL